jgi:hypothetical protein
MAVISETQGPCFNILFTRATPAENSAEFLRLTYSFVRLISVCFLRIAFQSYFFIFIGATTLCASFPPSMVHHHRLWKFLNSNFFPGVGFNPHAQPPTWRTRDHTSGPTWYRRMCRGWRLTLSPTNNTHNSSAVNGLFHIRWYTTSTSIKIQDDSKLLSGFAFIDLGNPDSNLESLCIISTHRIDTIHWNKSLLATSWPTI